MRRFLFATTICFVGLGSGCGALRSKPVAAYDQALLDRQLMDVAQSIVRTQAELRGLAVVSQAPGTASPRSGTSLPATGKSITIDWQGDAAELTRVLATQQGLAFETRGIKVPMPVTLTADHLPYPAALAQLAAQLDYRAAVYGLPGRLVLEYLPTTGVAR